MSRRDKARAQLSLIDVLHHLGTDAKDTFVGYLQQYNALKDVRLGCRALQQAVDSSVLHVSLNITGHDTELWSSGVVPPLRRWPRCSEVTVKLITGASAADDHAGVSQLLGNLLGLPFTGQPLGVRQRITCLNLFSDGVSQSDDDWDVEEPAFLPPPCAPGSALAAVFHSLPNLRRVSVDDLLPTDPLQQRVVYDALSSLPHLEELHVPICRALENVGLLSDRLRRLSAGKCSSGVCKLDAPMVAGIAALRQLEHLELSLFAHLTGRDKEPRDLLCTLLSSLPPSLQVLELLYFDTFSEPVKMTLRMSASRLSSFEISSGHITLRDLARVAEQVLLQSGVVPADSHVERIRVPALDVYPESGRVMQGPEGVSLRELLQRTRTVEVDTIRFRFGVSVEDVLEVIQLVGMPAQLEFSSEGSSGIGLHVRARPLQPNRQPEDGGAAQAADEAASEPREPRDVPSLVRLALARMTAAAATEREDGAWRTGDDADCADDSPPMRSPAAADSAPQDDEALAPPGPSLLLLRGPLLAGLAWAPSALAEWLCKLSDDAAAIVNPDGDDDSDGPMMLRRSRSRSPCISAYLALLHGAGVLVRCSALPGASEALKVVVRRAAAAAQAGAIGEASPQLQVLPVAAPGLSGEESPSEALAKAFKDAIQEVAQAAWDGVGFSDGWTLRQRLQWLLRQVEAELRFLEEPEELERHRVYRR